MRGCANYKIDKYNIFRVCLIISDTVLINLFYNIGENTDRNEVIQNSVSQVQI